MNSPNAHARPAKAAAAMLHKAAVLFFAELSFVYLTTGEASAPPLGVD
jgi:hypothetical protein